MSAFDAFIDTLAAVPLSPRAFNQYARDNESNALRRHNLRLYLAQMAAKTPTVMLVGEAPGYRGCRLTGVPFTSPAIIRDGLDAAGLFGQARGYQTSPEWPEIRRESSATILWQTLLAHEVPLLWNAFPFHPFINGRPQSNRAPTMQELGLGEPFVRALRQQFPITVVVAVGNKAGVALTRWGIHHNTVRHPAQGGKADFVAGIARLMGEPGD